MRLDSLIRLAPKRGPKKELGGGESSTKLQLIKNEILKSKTKHRILTHTAFLQVILFQGVCHLEEYR